MPKTTSTLPNGSMSLPVTALNTNNRNLAYSHSPTAPTNSSKAPESSSFYLAKQNNNAKSGDSVNNSNRASSESPTRPASHNSLLKQPKPVMPPPANLSIPLSQTASSGAKQLSKLKRFLTTLQQFASDISPEIGDRVRNLVLSLVVSKLNMFTNSGNLFE